MILRKRCLRYKKGGLFLGAWFRFRGVGMRVSVNHRGKVYGLSKVLTAAIDAWGSRLGVTETSVACEDFGRLSCEIAELAWICREGAAGGKHFCYEIEVFVTNTGLTWQRYRVAVENRHPLCGLMRHGLVALLHRVFYT